MHYEIRLATSCIVLKGYENLETVGPLFVMKQVPIGYACDTSVNQDVAEKNVAESSTNY